MAIKWYKDPAFTMVASFFYIPIIIEPDINGDAFDMDCRGWKARWSGEQKPPSTMTTTLDVLDAELYPNIPFILTVLLTIPVSTATAEMFFSSMKRIKAFLRATMTQIPGLIHWPLFTSIVISG